jgi:hypothetical protein
MKSSKPNLAILSAFAIGLGMSQTASAEWWQPTPDVNWQIQLTGTVDTSVDAQIFDIDLFDVSPSTIDALHAKGAKVICYFSAGSSEDWRPDYSQFPAVVKGNGLDGWQGENWLDVRRLDILLPIMEARIQLASDKGCDAVDPDNVDGYSNSNGFGFSYNDQLQYNIALTQAAHNLGLGIGLKNDLDQIKDLVSYYDFAVNEQCFQYGECDMLTPFINAKKAVLSIEYSTNSSSICPQAEGLNFDTLLKRLDLNVWRQACRVSPVNAGTVVGTPSAPTTTKAPTTTTTTKAPVTTTTTRAPVTTTTVSAPTTTTTTPRATTTTTTLPPVATPPSNTSAKARKAARIQKLKALKLKRLARRAI